MNNLAVSWNNHAQVADSIALQDLAASFAALQQSVEQLSQSMQALLQTAQEMLESIHSLLETASGATVQGQSTRTVRRAPDVGPGTKRRHDGHQAAGGIGTAVRKDGQRE